MIPDILIALLSGLVSTVTMWSLKFTLTINSVYIILLNTFWMMFFISIMDNRRYYFIISGVGLVITYCLVRSQMFVNKSELYEEIIQNHEKSIIMSKEVLDNSNISNADKKRIFDIIRGEQEQLTLIKNKY